jgi:hypothetical protein
MLKTNKTRTVYKTVIVNIKNKTVVDIAAPDDGGKWELYSIIVRKNKIIYTWEKQEVLNTFSSSEEAFQKSLDMVKMSTNNFDQVEIKEKE